jgi:hypothetical protein
LQYWRRLKPPLFQAYGKNGRGPRSYPLVCIPGKRLMWPGMAGIFTLRCRSRSASLCGDSTSLKLYALCPSHFSTPRYALHGPTACRYWCAMTREIWCRWVRSWAAHVASSSDRVTVPRAGCRPRLARSPALRFNA